jgi:hypothetical protein
MADSDKAKVITIRKDDDTLPIRLDLDAISNGDRYPSPGAEVLAAAGTPDTSAAAPVVVANTDQGPGLWSAFWNSPWRWVVLSGLGLLLLIELLKSHGSDPTKTVKIPSKMNATQAAMIQSQVDQQIASAGAVLKAAGYSRDAIATAQNQAALDYGTRIALATVVTSRRKNTAPQMVIGEQSPAGYVPLKSLNTRAYTASLSMDPTQNDIEDNSAVVHGGMHTVTQK